jgi:hypothetical protein
MAAELGPRPLRRQPRFLKPEVDDESVCASDSTNSLASLASTTAVADCNEDCPFGIGTQVEGVDAESPKFCFIAALQSMSASRNSSFKDLESLDPSHEELEDCDSKSILDLL